MWRLASLKLSTSNLVAGKIYISLSGVWPGVNLSPSPPTASGAWQMDPRCLSTDSPILPERTESSCPEDSLPWREGVSVRRDGLGGYNLHLAHEGRMAERTASAPKGARLAGPSKTGQESALLAFPAHPLPLLLSLFKNPINTHFKWNLKLLLCERTL